MENELGKCKVKYEACGLILNQEEKKNNIKTTTKNKLMNVLFDGASPSTSII